MERQCTVIDVTSSQAGLWFNTVPIEIPRDFFGGICQPNFNIYMQTQRAKRSPLKKTRGEDLLFPCWDLLWSHIRKAKWVSTEADNGPVGKREIPETGLSTPNMDTIYGQGSSIKTDVKESPVQLGVLGSWLPRGREIELDSISIHTKISSSWIKAMQKRS